MESTTTTHSSTALSQPLLITPREEEYQSLIQMVHSMRAASEVQISPATEPAAPLGPVPAFRRHRMVKTQDERLAAQGLTDRIADFAHP